MSDDGRYGSDEFTGDPRSMVGKEPEGPRPGPAYVEAGLEGVRRAREELEARREDPPPERDPIEIPVQCVHAVAYVRDGVRECADCATPLPEDDVAPELGP